MMASFVFFFHWKEEKKKEANLTSFNSLTGGKFTDYSFTNDVLFERKIIKQQALQKTKKNPSFRKNHPIKFYHFNKY